MTRQEGTMSYVTSDSEGRGDVQAVSIPSNERRRVGARNGIEVRNSAATADVVEPCC